MPLLFLSRDLRCLFSPPRGETAPRLSAVAVTRRRRGMRGVTTTAVLALAAGCFAYPLTSSRQVEQEEQVCGTIPPEKTKWGIQPQASFGGHCCEVCSEGRYICCPTVDTKTGEPVSARPDLSSHTPHSLAPLVWPA